MTYAKVSLSLLVVFYMHITMPLFGWGIKVSICMGRIQRYKLLLNLEFLSYFFNEIPMHVNHINLTDSLDLLLTTLQQTPSMSKATLYKVPPYHIIVID